MKEKRVIEIILDTTGVYVVTFKRWNEYQGYVEKHSYSWINQYSYARLLRTLAQYKYFGFLVTKG